MGHCRRARVRRTAATTTACLGLRWHGDGAHRGVCLSRTRGTDPRLCLCLLVSRYLDEHGSFGGMRRRISACSTSYKCAADLPWDEIALRCCGLGWAPRNAPAVGDDGGGGGSARKVTPWKWRAGAGKKEGGVGELNLMPSAGQGVGMCAIAERTFSLRHPFWRIAFVKSSPHSSLRCQR